MKDSFFLESNFSHSDLDRMRGLIESSSSNFVELVNLAGLNPHTDLRYLDLAGVSFDDCDIRGFDFTGTNLIGAKGNIRTLWDNSTILHEAQIDDSIFQRGDQEEGVSSVLPEGFFRQHWVDLALWLNSNSVEKFTDEYASQLVEITLKSDDQYVRKSAMETLSRNVSIETLFSIIENRFITTDDKFLAKAAFQLLGSLYADNIQETLAVATRQLRGPWAAFAAELLVQKLPYGNQLKYLIELMSRHEDILVRRSFIAKLAERQGEATELIVRNPLSGDVFDFHSFIRKTDLENLTRVVIRRRQFEKEFLENNKFGRNFYDQVYTGAVSKEFYAKNTKHLEMQIFNRLDAFNKFGLGYKLPIFATAHLEL
ncbi:MAG: pentapeptide repeat-containing protein [Hoeflea sp.]|uniref:pentapeptide repeat-containing protein n=1 Tax=Hoeflea sp. TaxID=1940281 RepID=UPI0027306BDA|nr:pentapeptide repeat-containing protein [Hoeflea sp.]MDP2121278.1 pentapeptide repeat-containing protein [Hoeflea sp.]